MVLIVAHIYVYNTAKCNMKVLNTWNKNGKSISCIRFWDSANEIYKDSIESHLKLSKQFIAYFNKYRNNKAQSKTN